MNLDPGRLVGFESRKAYRRRCESGFWDRWLRGPNVLDIGFRGGIHDALPIVESAIGIGLDFPGYDGLHLPFPDGWAATVHASHVLEHVAPAEDYLREWFRVIPVGGTMILFVPSAYLYERRLTVPPSRFSPEHLRSYTPASLLAEVEHALEPNTYRVRHLADNDEWYDYSLPIETHPVGCLEIELVLEKITPPVWAVDL
jgi:SAM-dependent methyltransferase